MEELTHNPYDGEPLPQHQSQDDAFALLQREQNALRFSAVSTGTFFWWGLLYAVPVIGWLICAVSAFTLKNVSHRNFARATLIRIVVGVLVLCLAGYLALQFAGSALMGLVSLFTGTSTEDMEQLAGKVDTVVEEMQSGQYDEFLGQMGSEHPELENVLGGIKQEGLSGVVDQLQSDDFKEMADKYINGEYNDLFDRMEKGEFGDLGALGDLYHGVSGNFKNGNEDYVLALYTAVKTGKPMEGVDADGLAVLTQIYRALDAEQKAMLDAAMDDYREMGYKRLLEKYSNGDYDQLLSDIKSGKYGDLTPLIQRLMTLYILGGF